MRYLAALLALAGTAASAQEPQVPRWNPKAPENEELLPALNYAAVEGVLDAVGARYQRSGSAPDRPVILVSFANNRRAVLIFSACDSDGSACKALSIQSYWTKIANAPPQRTASAIADFNRRFSFAKAFVATDGRPTLQRYLTADYGIVRGNLAVNLLVFATQAERFATDVLNPLEAGRL